MSLQGDLDALLLRFDQVWQQGGPPSIEEFLAAVASAGAAARRGFLEELVMIDLEYRWRLAALGVVAPAGPIRERPRLEDYVAHHGALGGLAQLSPELLSAEYRVRRRWGDRPSHEEYAVRFPRQRAALADLLRQIDGEVAAEGAGREGPALAGNQPAARRSAGVGITSVAAFIDILRRMALLEAAQLADVTGRLAPRLTDPRGLARELLQRGWLTPYQVNQLFLGRAAELVLGSYLILERLGEGGTGQVFKARHLRMNRVVALKLLRKELLADAEVVQRFYREVRVISQLAHPNVVRGLDAGPFTSPAPFQGEGEVKGHLLAMEYVEGTDLARLVKQEGPLPVERACACVLQAASGLQHAHERGLVHRDVKPHNLLLARTQEPQSTGVVKILDLGLARLRQPMDQETTARLEQSLAGSLTPVGAVMMGTADYMAPEQALDFHTADIRADVYSLGATFYFLLTGQPPFPGGTLTQKLLRHQQEEAPRLERCRPAVPPAVAAVVRKMLAKRPEDRYQTPAEVVAALTALDAAGRARVPASSPRRRFLRRAGGGLVLAGAAAVSWGLLSSVRRRWFPPPDWGEAYWQHDGPVRALVFSPDSGRLYSCADDLIVYAVERAAGQRHVALDFREKLPGAARMAFAANGSMLALGTPSRNKESVALWSLVTKEAVRTLHDHAVSSGLQYIALSAEGKGLASTGGRGVKLTNAVTGRYSSLLPNVGGVQAVAFSADSKTLAIAGDDRDRQNRQISLFDLTLDSRRDSLAEERLGLTGQGTRPRALAFSADGRALASGSGDGTVRLWEPVTGKLLHTLTLADGGVHVIAFSPDSRTLAVGSDQQVQLWDAATGRAMRAWPAHAQAVLALAFAPDGSCLASGGDDHSVRLWTLPK